MPRVRIVAVLVPLLLLGGLLSADQAALGLGAPLTETPTPSPEPSLTATPLPGKAAPTETPTVSEPGATATPALLEGSAVIDGNFFHPLQGGLLPLKYLEPYPATVTIDLYNRLGHLVKHLSQTEGPGTYTVYWDGRGDEGQVVASGIYVAHFYGRGLNRLVKFAVIK